MKRALIVVAKAAMVIIGAAATWAATAFAVATCLDWLDVPTPRGRADTVASAVALAVFVGILFLWIKLVVGWRALTVTTIRTAFRATDGWRAIWEEAKRR